MRGIRALETEEEAAESGLPVSEQIRASIRASIEGAVEAHKARLHQDDRLVVQVELLNRSIERLTEELGTKPNIDEIANDMKTTQETVLKILKLTGEGISDEDFIPPKS
jgi:DNA-directed RNA polymerase sigma subunit (sigma70/sigma32)